MPEFIVVAGARPNFMKIAPLREALVRRGAKVTLVHTGQHYDENMSDVFFRELGMPNPDINLGIGPGTRIQQTQKILDALIPILKERRPDAVIAPGDVTSTAAAAMASAAAGIPFAHVEAGLRSYNWRMPEELNRMIADHHSQWLFAPDEASAQNLRNEGIPSDRIFVVGNIMIDSLRSAEARAETSPILARLEIQPSSYALITMHRPENVDDPETFSKLISILNEASEILPAIFPVHPRTRGKLDKLSLKLSKRIQQIEPVGYLDQIALMKNASHVLTDSGGIQEETTVLGIPCLTLRTETERPITSEIGTNEVLGHDREKILDAVNRVMAGSWKKGSLPELWDGKAAERIAEILVP